MQKELAKVIKIRKKIDNLPAYHFLVEGVTVHHEIYLQTVTN